MRSDQDIASALKDLSSDERTALVFGFPLPPSEDNFDGLSDTYNSLIQNTFGNFNYFFII